MDKSSVEPTIFFIEKISFSLKLFSGHFYGQSFIKTVRGPLPNTYDHHALIVPIIIIGKHFLTESSVHSYAFNMYQSLVFSGFLYVNPNTQLGSILITRRGHLLF